MRKQELIAFKKRIIGLQRKMEEMDIVHDFRAGYNYLGYSYSKGSYYSLCFRTGRKEDRVYKNIKDITIRRLLYATDERDILRICLTVEDIIRLMNENDSYSIFETIYFLMEEALNEAIFTVEDAIMVLRKK